MNEILYSDIEVTAKIVMDPRTMQNVLNDIDDLISKHNESDYRALDRLAFEMRQALHDFCCNVIDEVHKKFDC